MRKHGERPRGIAVIAVLMALHGISSILEAFGFVALAASHPNKFELVALGAPGAVVSAVLGIELLHRAYNIWQLRREAWQITLLLLGLRAVIALVSAFSSPLAVVGWIDLVLVVVTVLYLIQPRVRILFASR